MSNGNDNRVLSRMGAHELTQEQTEAVEGGLLTVPSVIVTGTPPHYDISSDS
jgi:hypothetical protein